MSTTKYCYYHDISQKYPLVVDKRRDAEDYRGNVFNDDGTLFMEYVRACTDFKAALEDIETRARQKDERTGMAGPL